MKAAAQPAEVMTSECSTCGGIIPITEHRCLCDEINDAMESLKAAADNRGKHAELLASLRVVLRGLQAQ